MSEDTGVRADNDFALDCIVCGKHLAGYFPDRNQPARGTAFATQGHYGSTVFDPMDGSAIEINVCDECLTEKAAKGYVAHYTAKEPPTGHMTLWRNAVGETDAS